MPSESPNDGILCSLPKAQYEAHRAEIEAAIARVLDSGWYILGEEVAAFENEFAAYLGADEVVAAANGTEALFLALKAAGIGAGDEVITVSHTAVATVAAIEMAGAAPVLVDVEPDFYTLDPTAIEAAVSPRTKAIVPVHLYGQPADMDAILDVAQRHGLRVVEDCAQAAGALYKGRRVGTLGDFGCFSFYPTKNLGALGDGGAIATRDPKAAARLRMLREYGWDGERRSQIGGYNSRLDELQAAILRVKLPHLDDDNEKRDALAACYDGAFTNLPIICPQRRPGCSHVFHHYVIETDKRDDLKAALRERGVLAGIHYPQPVHREPGYGDRVRVAGALAHTERLAGQVLSLPMYPELDEAQVARIVAAVSGYFQTKSS